MTIRSLIRSPIRKGVRNLIGGAGNLFGIDVLFETTGGDLLYTTDEAMLTVGGPRAMSAQPPPVLLQTTDGDTLYTTDESLLTV